MSNIEQLIYTLLTQIICFLYKLSFSFNATKTFGFHFLRLYSHLEIYDSESKLFFGIKLYL